jgi:hypothetical protein
MWCGQMARRAVASACGPVALGNRDIPIAELYEWGRQHDGHIERDDVLASSRHRINVEPRGERTQTANHTELTGKNFSGQLYLWLRIL